METTLLANTSISASRIALGTWAIGGWMRGGSDEHDGKVVRNSARRRAAPTAGQLRRPLPDSPARPAGADQGNGVPHGRLDFTLLL
jgi:hypothetical protein